MKRKNMNKRETEGERVSENRKRTIKIRERV